VRAELVRRRSACLEIEAPPRLARVISSAGLAPTVAAEWRAPKTRWQYAVGVIAIAASASLFFISRGGDTVAAAATSSPTAALHQPALQADAIATPAPATPVAVVAAEPAVVEPIKLTPARPSRATTTGRSTSMAYRPSSRKAPVAPRRATKIDPDGTLDPYR
jgi:hypothetical protein